jgi:ubiquinone/menaquinone biosynthesis C-methylase UbiE
MPDQNQKSRWEVFFDAHASKYNDEVFTKNTTFEIEFLVTELALPTGSAILDVGCGTGRHTVGLANRGYRMTGVDLSSGMLAQANRAAHDAGVEVVLVQADATKMSFESRFDAAICLCEGSFGLLDQDDDPLAHDLDILKRINTALKPGGKLILNALNGAEKLRRLTNDDVAQGRFDPFMLIEWFTMEYDTPDGKKSVKIRERGYIASEVMLMLSLAGFDTLHVWGSTAGNWRKGPLELDEMEMMVVAVKKN